MICCSASAAGSFYVDDLVGARQERGVEAGDEVGRDDEHEVRVRGRELVHRGQHRVGGPVHVDRVRRQRRRRARDRHRLNLVEQDDGRGAVIGQAWEMLGKQFGDELLAAAVFAAHQSVRVDLQEPDLRPAVDVRQRSGQPASERRLARARGADQGD